MLCFGRFVLINKTFSKSIHVHNIKHFGKRVGIIGVPFEKGQLQRGVGQGPDILRKHGLIRVLENIGCKVSDYGDIKYIPFEGNADIPNMNDLKHVAACQLEVSLQVQNILSKENFCLTLGGDHSLAIGSIDAHHVRKKDVAVLWIDAHADINTAETSPTGNIHGMPVALLAEGLSDYWPYLPGMDWQKPRLSLRNFAYIGLRDVDAGERTILQEFGITAFNMTDIEQLGISHVVHLALRSIDPEQRRSLHVSFDIDAIDCLEAPSTGTPVRGGLTLREGIQILEECYRTQRFNCMDLVEINPNIGDARDVRLTMEASILLCKAACGYSRSGHTFHKQGGMI